MRAIAGLWPWGGGAVEVKKGAKMFLLPQTALRPGWHAAGAPPPIHAADARATEEVAEAFKRVGLGHLIDKLEEDAPWDQTLSGGEKQRLAFARILLHKPDIVVLDEATSALDPDSQDKLMKMLTEELHATTVVSVGHRPELEQFHSRKITLERRQGGAKLVNDIELVRKTGRSKLLRRWLGRRGPPAEPKPEES